MHFLQCHQCHFHPRCKHRSQCRLQLLVPQFWRVSPQSRKCTEAIFNKRDSLVTVVFFGAISASGGLHHGGHHQPSKSCRPITICSPSHSHVDYITSVESKEVSIPEREKLNFSRGKNLLYTDFLCSLFVFGC
jgi:hypothetical protein